MIERCKHFGFALKPRQSFGGRGDGFRQELDRDSPVQVRVCRAIHLAHTTNADLGGDFVWAESRARASATVVGILGHRSWVTPQGRSDSERVRLLGTRRLLITHRHLMPTSADVPVQRMMP